jgi:hypothetical protein
MPARKSKKQTSNRPSPPLNDPRWVSLTMAHHMRSEQLTGKRFSPRASTHLMEALKSGELQCRRESRKDPSEREPVLSSFWQGLRIHEDPDGGIIQLQRDRMSQGENPHDLGQLFEWAYDVWMPDFDKLWPSAKADQEATEMSPRRKPGPTPIKNWKLHVAAELYRIFEIEGKQPPPASYFADFCRDKLNYVPDMRAIQRLLKHLL